MFLLLCRFVLFSACKGTKKNDIRKEKPAYNKIRYRKSCGFLCFLLILQFQNNKGYMKITLLQQNIVWNNPQENQKAAEEAIFAADRSDVYVLPEMWSTGFATDPVGIAEDKGLSLRWMQDIATRMNAAVAGSVATEVDGRYYNRFYFVTPDDFKCYDKRHLFTYGGEDKRYTAGNERVVVEWRGVRFLLQVCYDLRFPVFSRNIPNTGFSKEEETSPYDVALYVASWPDSRRSVWDALLVARAIENQCYVCGVNRVGDDAQCHYNGGTVCVDAYGRIVAQCADETQSAVTVEVDMEKLKRFRAKFPVLSDADNS